MAYTDLAKLTASFGEDLLLQLADRDGSGAVDDGVVDGAIADTDAAIDGYLAGRYKLPLATTPPLLADLAAAIAIYKLHTYEPDAKIAEDYKDAMRQLREIAAGTIRLPAEGVEPEGTGASGVRVTDRERPFTEQNLKGFI